jgi:hypothetical protein
MDSQRQIDVFRAFVKQALRSKGLRFDKNTQRDIGRELKNFNEESGLNKPLTFVEFCEFYLDIMKELVAEHFTSIEKKIDEHKRGKQQE